MKHIAAGGLRGLLFSLPCAGLAYAVDGLIAPMCDMELGWPNALRLLMTASTYLVALVILAMKFAPPELDVVRNKIRARFQR